MLGAYGGSSPWHRQTSFLLDGTVSLDAGALTQSLTLEEQARVRSIIITHSHLDHVASLPFLVENVFGRTSGAIEIVATKEVAGLLQDHLFNDAIWPDFTRIPNHLLPAVTFRVIEAGVPVNLYHMKPPTLPQLRADVAALSDPRIRLLDDGDELEV